MDIDRWILPEGIEEVLPKEARQLEALRRRLIDLFNSWGYDLVIPPFVEYIESLLTGTGNDLDLQTFKLIDQRNGRMMGVRADMTPQVARIDAHRINKQEPTRLCYVGTVLRTQGDSLASSRSITQIGAELYGHHGIESDTELLKLMLAMLESCQIQDINLDLGHVSIFGGLAKQAGLSPEQETGLFDALQRKAAPEINAMLAEWSLEKSVSEMLAQLMWLNGGVEILQEAKQKLASANEDVKQALDKLQQIALQLQQQYPSIAIHIDLAELRGYHYHTGIVFAAYQPGMGQAIAQGGRYDDIGEVFGRARPATGFSADLKTLMQLGELKTNKSSDIFAPADNDEALNQKVNELRQAGERVICALPGQQGNAISMGCGRALVLENNEWAIKVLN